MSMTYTMNICGLKRDLPLCRVSDDLYIGAFVIFGDVELTSACAAGLLKVAPEHDILITAESKGIPLVCIDQDDADAMRGKRVLIVDDVISTGESLKAVEKLVTQAGGIIVGKMAILAEGAAQERDDIIYLEKLPLFNPDGTVKA